MTAGPPIDGTPSLVTGGDDGTVRRWDAETGQQLGPPLRSGGGAVWGMTVARLPSGSPIVVSCSNDGVLCRWDDTGARLGAPIVVGPGALTAAVAVTCRTAVWRRSPAARTAGCPAGTPAPVSRLAAPGRHLTAVIVLQAIALAAVLWGSAHGRNRQASFQLQIVGMIAFGALALAGLVVAPDVARYVVAAGWFAHGLWDFAHLRADAVVSRSFAEWCGVVDVLIAAELVILPLLR
ncbi:MAG: hypothetical protein ACT4NP_10855 [Pseudonocardiales bacterium]